MDFGKGSEASLGITMSHLGFGLDCCRVLWTTLAQTDVDQMSKDAGLQRARLSVPCSMLARMRANLCLLGA